MAGGNSASFDSLLGGDSRIEWTYTPQNGQALPKGVFYFKICGTNPEFADIDSVLATSPYWFQRNIAIHETNESQFCEGTRTRGSTGYCRGDQVKDGLPILGAPAGYGMTQLDPTPSVDAMWNWRTNIVAGQDRIGQNPGYTFWTDQVDQWVRFNAGRKASNQTQIPMAVDPPTNDLSTYFNSPVLYDQLKSSFCTFTMSLSSGQTSINTGQPNPAWFGDAILMKRQGGANPDYLSWVNGGKYGVKYVNNPRWLFAKDNSVSKNIVYEFCTCIATGQSGCVRDMKCGGPFDGVTLPKLTTCTQ